MTEHDDGLDVVFSALAHPLRRDILTHLATGELSVSELAAPMPVSLAAASKHVQVLERAGLIERNVLGRRHQFRLRRERLGAAGGWLGEHAVEVTTVEVATVEVTAPDVLDVEVPPVGAASTEAVVAKPTRTKKAKKAVKKKVTAEAASKAAKKPTGKAAKAAKDKKSEAKKPKAKEKRAKKSKKR